jgi:Flp pilus assembly protein TadG
MRRFLKEEAGVSAVEFALVLPIFLALTLGAMNFSLLTFLNSRLHYAVDDAARCMAVNQCTAANVSAHASANFNFPSVSPSFTGVSSTCNVSGGSGGQTGYLVTGTATYDLNVVVASLSVPITATSCFAAQD